MNISLPRSEDNPVDDQPWPHVDQSPLKREKHCVQGIMNLVRSLPLIPFSSGSGLPLTSVRGWTARWQPDGA